MKLFGFRLLVGDFAASLAFWRDVMQLPLQFSDADIGYAYFTLEPVALELFQRDAFAQAIDQATPVATPTGHQTVINMQVDDVDATYAELVARGATSVYEPIDRPLWRARTAHISDPDGNIIEIYSSLPEGATPTA